MATSAPAAPSAAEGLVYQKFDAGAAGSPVEIVRVVFPDAAEYKIISLLPPQGSQMGDASNTAEGQGAAAGDKDEPIQICYVKDTSGSTLNYFDSSRPQLRRISRRLGDRVSIFSFSDGVVPVFAGTMGGLTESFSAVSMKLQPSGGTRLDLAIEHIFHGIPFTTEAMQVDDPSRPSFAAGAAAAAAAPPVAVSSTAPPLVFLETDGLATHPITFNGLSETAFRSLLLPILQRLLPLEHPLRAPLVLDESNPPPQQQQALQQQPPHPVCSESPAVVERFKALVSAIQALRAAGHLALPHLCSIVVGDGPDQVLRELAEMTGGSLGTLSLQGASSADIATNLKCLTRSMTSTYRTRCGLRGVGRNQSLAAAASGSTGSTGASGSDGTVAGDSATGSGSAAGTVLTEPATTGALSTAAAAASDLPVEMDNDDNMDLEGFRDVFFSVQEGMICPISTLTRTGVFRPTAAQEEEIIPPGNTVLKEGDRATICGFAERPIAVVRCVADPTVLNLHFSEQYICTRLGERGKVESSTIMKARSCVIDMDARCIAYDKAREDHRLLGLRLLQLLLQSQAAKYGCLVDSPVFERTGDEEEDAEREMAALDDVINDEDPAGDDRPRGRTPPPGSALTAAGGRPLAPQIEFAALAERMTRLQAAAAALGLDDPEMATNPECKLLCNNLKDLRKAADEHDTRTVRLLLNGVDSLVTARVERAASCCSPAYAGNSPTSTAAGFRFDSTSPPFGRSSPPFGRLSPSVGGTAYSPTSPSYAPTAVTSYAPTAFTFAPTVATGMTSPYSHEVLHRRPRSHSPPPRARSPTDPELSDA